MKIINFRFFKFWTDFYVFFIIFIIFWILIMFLHFYIKKLWQSWKNYEKIMKKSQESVQNLKNRKFWKFMIFNINLPTNIKYLISYEICTCDLHALHIIEIQITLGNPYNFHSKSINIAKIKGGGSHAKIQGDIYIYILFLNMFIFNLLYCRYS